MLRRVLILVATRVVPFAAKAQMSGGLTRPISFGVAAATAVPVSTLSDVAKTGFDIAGIAGLKLPVIPFGLRLDASYSAFGKKSDVAGSGRANIGSVTGNVVLGMPLVLIYPYVIGGIGYYDVSVPSAKSSNGFGFNVGVGVGVGLPLTGLNLFAEARYNRVSTSGESTQFVPVRVGMMF